jgi:hypothetical protein
MTRFREWLFRILVVASAGVMLYSWFQPWWTIHIEELGNNMLQIRPWGLIVDARLGSYDILIKGAAMPDWFGPMMWVYLGLCMLALLVGLFVLRKDLNVIGRLKVNLSMLLVGGVGFSYLVAGVVMAVYASTRLKSFYDVPLQGRMSIELSDMHSYVESSLLPGYYLIYVAGGLLVVLALLRGVIIGKKQ